MGVRIQEQPELSALLHDTPQERVNDANGLLVQKGSRAVRSKTDVRPRQHELTCHDWRHREVNGVAAGFVARDQFANSSLGFSVSSSHVGSLW
jgi:hypothetical protein